MTRTPPRLLHDSNTGSELRAALEHAASDGPSAAELSTLLARVDVQGPGSSGSGEGPGGEGVSGPGAEWAAAKGSLAIKLGGVVVLGGALLAGLQIASREGPHAAPSSVRPVAVVAPTTPSTEATAAVAEEAPVPEAPRAEEPARPRPSPSLHPTGGAARIQPPAGAPPSPVGPQDPSVSDETEPMVPLKETELELLSRARRELASNPSAALALAERHRTEFPSGHLIEEREVIAIEALARAGSLEEARNRYTQFARRYGSSVHRQRLEALLGHPPE